MAQLPLIRQNQAANAHIDGATPSYLPTPINQPNQNMPHRSELSQDRRQNHQERHQSYPKTGGKTTRQDISIIPWWFCLLSWDNSDVFPGGFASCLGITLIDVAYFGWVGWWASGDMRELRHLCGHLQPDFGEWVGVAPSMSLKMTYVLPSSALWQFATLLGPGKRAPPSPPKRAFSWVSQSKLDTWWGPFFLGRTQVENWHCAGFPPFFSQHQAAFLGHRWRNSHSFAKIRLGMPT